jgi:Leucine-rich repeat (LRR) protein
MPRNLKFNLIHNSQSIRTIDELREYCAIEQLLIDYREGKLQKWLKALRCFDDIITNIDCISVENDLELAQELVRILEIKQQAFEDYQARFLMYNNQYIKTIDDLREYCAIEQLLIDYREGKLQRWLKALRCFDDIITDIDCIGSIPKLR